MSFGASYSYQKQPKVLSNGDYNVTLEVPYETTVSGYNVLRFPFTVDGETEKVIPNYFDLFDCTDPTNPAKIEQFKKQASKIKACFKLSGPFNETNYTLWAKHKGKIRIEKSDTGFVNVVQFYKAELTSQEEMTL